MTVTHEPSAKVTALARTMFDANRRAMLQLYPAAMVATWEQMPEAMRNGWTRSADTALATVALDLFPADAADQPVPIPPPSRRRRAASAGAFAALGLALGLLFPRPTRSRRA